MSGSEVTDYIAALRAGRMSLDEVAERFRQRDWPAARRPAPTTYAEMAQQQDVEPDVPGSYDEVTAAYDRGDLTSHEYRVLSDAVAEAINARTRAAGADHRVAGAGRAERPERPGPAAGTCDGPGGGSRAEGS
jgi:hypothetical protein